MRILPSLTILKHQICETSMSAGRSEGGAIRNLRHDIVLGFPN